MRPRTFNVPGTHEADAVRFAECSRVADAGLIAALPLSLAAGPKENRRAEPGSSATRGCPGKCKATELLLTLNLGLRVSSGGCQIALSGSRSPNWILNASSALVQARVRVH